MVLLPRKVAAHTICAANGAQGCGSHNMATSWDWLNATFLREHFIFLHVTCNMSIHHVMSYCVNYEVVLA